MSHILRMFINESLTPRPNKNRSVDDLVKDGYTLPQAKYIYRNIKDMQDMKSPGIEHIKNNIDQYEQLSGLPREIFRVVPKGEQIYPGDFVFDSNEGAIAYREHHGFIRGSPEIVSMTVKSEDLRHPDIGKITSGRYGNEFIYVPVEDTK